MNGDSIPKYIGMVLVVCLLGVLGYGLYNDFTPEYEASHPIQYEMVVWDENGNERVLSETGHGHGRNYVVNGGLVIPLTPLDEQGIKIQEEDGCIACHERK